MIKFWDRLFVILSRNKTSPDTDVRRVARSICMIAAALSILMFMDTPKPNHDVWHEMALARESIKLGHVPTTDLFSYAPTRDPVVDHEWLAGAVALAAYDSAKLRGFMLLWFGLTISLWTACVVGLRGTRPSAKIVGTVLMTPFVMYSQFEPCVAQAYSSLLAAVILVIVQLDITSRNRRWLLLCIPVSICTVARSLVW
jgi:hypothetical protein